MSFSLTRFSLSSLSHCKDLTLLSREIERRAALQLKTLSSVSLQTPSSSSSSSILSSLYRSSIETCERIRGKYTSLEDIPITRRKEVSGWIDSLCARHSLCVEVFADLHLQERKKEGVAVRRLLERQASLVAILEQLYSLSASSHKTHVSAFISAASLEGICTNAKFNAISLAEHQENTSPDVLIAEKKPLFIPFPLLVIPSRLTFCVLEALKNALYSTILQHSSSSSSLSEETSSSCLPPVCIDIVHNEAENMVLIRIIDEGIGIDPKLVPRQFTFLQNSTQKVRYSDSLLTNVWKSLFTVSTLCSLAGLWTCRPPTSRSLRLSRDWEQVSAYRRSTLASLVVMCGSSPLVLEEESLVPFLSQQVQTSLKLTYHLTMTNKAVVL